MTDFIRDAAIRLLLDHWQLIGLAVALVAALGTLLGTLKKLAASLFSVSLAAGEKWTAAVMSKKGRRVSVPVALALFLFGSGFLASAIRPPKVRYVAQPQVVERPVIREVVKEVKVPTIIEKIVEVPAKLLTPAANAKCYYCAALLNTDTVPAPSIRMFGDESDLVFRCGGCNGLLDVKEAKIRYRFKRHDKLSIVDPFIGDNVNIFTLAPLGKDPIPEPEPPPAGATETDRKSFTEAMENWKRQTRRYGGQG